MRPDVAELYVMILAQMREERRQNEKKEMEGQYGGRSRTYQ